MHHGNGSKVAGAHTGGFWITTCFLSTHLLRWVGGKEGWRGAREEHHLPPAGRAPWVSLPPSAAAPIVPQFARPPACVPGDRFINTRRCRGGSQQQRRLSRRPASLCNCWELRSPGGLPHPGLGHLHQHLRCCSPGVPSSAGPSIAPSLGRGLVEG